MKTIIEMAREAGFNTNHDMIWINKWEVSPYMQRFADLVRADEREACLGLAKDFAHNNADLHEAIRARGNT